MNRDPSFGCRHCWPESAEEAWEARSGLKETARPADESHYAVRVLKCRQCGQQFVSVFTEMIDWADGDDPQYWRMLPITAEEAAGLAGAIGTDTVIGGGRRSLRRDCPKDGPERTYWSTACDLNPPHD